MKEITIQVTDHEEGVAVQLVAPAGAPAEGSLEAYEVIAVIAHLLQGQSRKVAKAILRCALEALKDGVPSPSSVKPQPPETFTQN